MGRRPTHLKISAVEKARLTHLIKTNKDSRVSERLQFVLAAATGKYTLQDLAESVDRSRSTIQNWLSRFQNGGVDQLLARGTSPGRRTALSTRKVQEQLALQLELGRLTTASEIATWLKDEFGIRRARKSIYYWLNKPRPASRP